MEAHIYLEAVTDLPVVFEIDPVLIGELSAGTEGSVDAGGPGFVDLELVDTRGESMVGIPRTEFDRVVGTGVVVEIDLGGPIFYARAVF